MPYYDLYHEVVVVTHAQKGLNGVIMHTKTNSDLVVELHNIARQLEHNPNSPYYKHIAGILRTAADELSQVDKSLWAASFINDEKKLNLDLNHFKLMKAYTELKN